MKNNSFKKKVHEVIFEADTPTGKLFDIILLVLILISVLLVMLETVEQFDSKYHTFFWASEWVITIFFTIEYFLRLYSVKKPLNYATSFYGIVDLLSILPTYLSIILTGTHYFVILRALRLLRVFRVFKLGRYLGASQILTTALLASRVKITVFLVAVLTVVTVIGALMYLVEGGAGSGFTSIPKSIYWAIVTITTVGFGDIAPVTPLGQLLAAILMIMGYGVIAVPTGIVSAEIANASIEPDLNSQVCQNCLDDHHADDALFCKTCGGEL